MKIYSDTLTTADLYDAAKGVCGIWVCDTITRPKKRRNGWNVSLSGSSPYMSQMGDYHKAATWDEHGIWMDRLFDLDPHAIIATYDGRDDFIEQTQEAAERNGQYAGRRDMTAPWLGLVPAEAPTTS